MKKISILLFVLMMSQMIQAQIRWFKATELAVKLEYNDWSNWENVNIDVKVDLTNEIIVIYSKEPQVYKILKQLPDPYDSDGIQARFKILDQDYDMGNLRLRVQNNGTSQIYVDFSNISWVYNISPI